MLLGPSLPSARDGGVDIGGRRREADAIISNAEAIAHPQQANPNRSNPRTGVPSCRWLWADAGLPATCSAGSV
jgi:hypothetical protein